MQRALELSDDQVERADLYSLLAFHTAGRAGMWRRRPALELVLGWIDEALRLADAGSVPRARALIARCYYDKEKSAEIAAEASAIAERVGNVELRSYALDARGVVAFGKGDYGQALEWQQRRFDLVDEISDPDHIHDLHISIVGPCAAVGRFAEARRLAKGTWEQAQPLTPHHRLHGVSVLVEVEELAAGWQRILELRLAVERAVEENLATPCIRNTRSLLVCAAAAQASGKTAEAEALERAAEEIGPQGYDEVLNGPRLRLALARDDLDRARELLEDPYVMYGQGWFASSYFTARVDALATLGDRERVEGEAPHLLRPGTLFEPFALRALGVVRGDKTLVGQALERFEALGLDWHAEQTRALL